MNPCSDAHATGQAQSQSQVKGQITKSQRPSRVLLASCWLFTAGAKYHNIYIIYIYIYPYISYIHIPSKQEGSSYYSLVPLHGLKVSFLVPRGASTVRVVKRPAKAKATTGNRSFSGHRMSFVRIYGCNSTPHQ